jgi:hypothetical protein
MKEKNARSLDTIADDINQLARENIFAIGDLLIEAKARCEHGQWLNWLYSEFDWSTSTAERKMRVADLGGKFVKLTILKLGTTTLYDLADHENEDDLPAIIDELAKHATKTRLSPADARRVIKIGIGRQRFGNRPDATLLQLVELDQYNGEAWHDHAVATLQERSPETDEGANSIVDELKQAEEAEHRDAVEAAIDNIFNGPPPDLPPPAIPPEPQSWGAATAWPETDLFASAVKDLLELRAKPLQRFSGVFSSAELREVSAFLTSVAAVDERKAA